MRQSVHASGFFYLIKKLFREAVFCIVAPPPAGAVSSQACRSTRRDHRANELGAARRLRCATCLSNCRRLISGRNDFRSADIGRACEQLNPSHLNGAATERSWCLGLISKRGRRKKRFGSAVRTGGAPFETRSGAFPENHKVFWVEGFARASPRLQPCTSRVSRLPPVGWQSLAEICVACHY
jgi:hypothetical protein